MKAFILAGGEGDRLMPLTKYLPKPMAPVANRPVIAHVLDLLAGHGFTEVFTNPCHLGVAISAHFGDEQAHGVSLGYSFEEELRGTAGSVKRVACALSEGTFLVIGGDDLTDFDLSELLERHRRAEAMASIALKRVEDTTHYGVAITDASGRIQQFQEKPAPEEAISNLANTGIYLFEPEVLDFIPEEEFFDFALDLFPRLLAEEAPFFGFEMSGYWRDVGTLDDYLGANVDIVRRAGARLSERARAEIEAGRRSQERWHPSAVVVESAIVGRDCRLDEAVYIGEGCVIGRGCRISPGCRLVRSVVWPGVELPPDTMLFDSIVTPGEVVYVPPEAEPALVGAGSPPTEVGQVSLGVGVGA